MLKPFFFTKCLSTLNRKTEFQYFYSNILCMIKNYGLGCQGGPLWSVFIFLRKYKSWPQCGAVLPKRNSFELRSSSWVRTHDLPFLNSSFATQLRSEMAPKFEIRRHLEILNHFFITFRLNDFAKDFFYWFSYLHSLDQIVDELWLFPAVTSLIDVLLYMDDFES